MTGKQTRISLKQRGKTVADVKVELDVPGNRKARLPPDGSGRQMLDGWRAASTSLPARRDEIIAKQAKNPQELPNRGNAENAVRAAYDEAIKHELPALAEILEAAATEIVKKPLSERSTDELIVQIDAGRFLPEVARSWKVPLSELSRWISADADRIARTELARKNQAALWDWVALQVLLQAPSDRVEIARAEKIARHCRWRAEAFSRDDYGKNIKVTQVEEAGARALTTSELEIIARGDVLPG